MPSNNPTPTEAQLARLRLQLATMDQVIQDAVALTEHLLALLRTAPGQRPS